MSQQLAPVSLAFSLEHVSSMDKQYAKLDCYLNQWTTEPSALRYTQCSNYPFSVESNPCKKHAVLGNLGYGSTWHLGSSAAISKVVLRIQLNGESHVWIFLDMLS